MNVANPYWDAVQQWLGPSMWGNGLMLGALIPDELYESADIRQSTFLTAFEARKDLVQRYAWTVTDPDTVAFVVEHAGPKVADPLAGSGYWAYLLTGHGIDVFASDLHPPDRAENLWHAAAVVHHPVAQGDAVTAVKWHGDRTLLLAWPPYGQPVGADVLDAYPGERVVYLGEVGDACGDERMVDLLETRWKAVAYHTPVQWFGLHDIAAVYERNDR